MKSTVTTWRRCNMHKARGFTLLEFLITLLIVSLSLLGIAGIIGNSIKYNQSAYFRSQAVFLAGDIIDRMRANRIIADGGAASPYASPYNLTLGAAPSASGVPQSDLTEWRSALATTLPSGNGSIDVHTTTKKVTVVVRWDDSRAAGGANAQEFTIETRL